MNRPISTIALAAMMLTAICCRKEETAIPVFDDENVINSFTTPASTDAVTRMTLSYVSDESGWGISKRWNEGDSLIGFVIASPAEYKYFTYVCSGISDGTAIWTRVSESSSKGYPRRDESARLNMAYAPGVSASSFAQNGKFSVNDCTGAIACGSGEYDCATRKLDIVFSNQMAMVCLVSPVLEGVSAKTSIDHIDVRGVNTEGSLEIRDGSLKLIPNIESAGKAIIRPATDENWTTDATGKLDGSIFIPVLPGTLLKNLSFKFVSNNSKSYYYNVSGEAAIAATSYRIKEKTFRKAEAEYCIGNTLPIATNSVQDAFSAANSATQSTVITLEDNISLSESISITNASAPITLDLNGRSLTAINTGTHKPVITMKTAGSDLTVADNSLTGGGKIDQKYNGGTGYAIVVNAGTLNITGGTICNSSSTGFGRIAIDITGSSPIVNISGGYVYGGRAITLGTGKSGAPATLNVSGGRIEGKYSIASDIYAAIYVDDHSRATITGGSIHSAKAPCIYVRNDMKDVEVVLGAKDQTKAPYLFTSGHTRCIQGGNEDKYYEASFKKYSIYRSFWNKNVLAYPDKLCAEVSALDKKVTDGYGKEYGYMVESSPDGSTTTVKDGDTTTWY